MNAVPIPAPPAHMAVPAGPAAATLGHRAASPPVSASTPLVQGSMGGPAPQPAPGAVPLPTPMPDFGGIAGMATAAAVASTLAPGAVASASAMSVGSRFSGLLPATWTAAGLREYRDAKFQNWRPLVDFLDVRRVRKPPNWDVVKERASNNLAYYQTNYAVVFTLICFYALLSSPFLLLSLGFLAVAYNVVNASQSSTIVIMGNSFSTAQASQKLPPDRH
ncbi:hypothetical protein H9P43_000070 [Blastocladiella emersonii ATCC 22665]|nr:hypothetical protein H9P43_000070 [Blastocladiella emersonii ATCC 22665]